MNYLIIPLGIFAISILGIIIIVARKFVFLRKLSPDVVEKIAPESDHFFAELFPEVADILRKINIRAVGVEILDEFEKLLRQFRLLALRFDVLTHKAINKVRKSSQEQEKIIEEKRKEEMPDDDMPEINALDLKQEEQRLIIEIAKNPKDANLYKELGTIYMKVGDLKDSKESFIKAVELNPQDVESKRRLERVEKSIEKNASVAQR